MNLVLKQWWLLACVGLICGEGVWAQTYPYQDTKLPVEQRVADLVGRMTLDEKIAQTMNAAPAIPRLGVPAYDYWSEGLHGIARAGYATMFPQAIGMAATWDKALVGQMGKTVGVEARAKYNDAVRHDNHARYYGLTVWSPNINIFRDPRWGRGQETYGEDPYLTARMGVAFVEGLQGGDARHPLAIATPKHFAVHSGPESSRHRFDVTPTPHDLEDTYLPAFRATITEAHADSLMCAYNAIDGVPACANTMLLVDKLRKAWGFAGFVTSDCGAVDDFFARDGHGYAKDAEHASAAASLAGTDTNCGDTYKALGKAVDEKLVPVSAIDTALTRLFTARFELGLFDGEEGSGTDGAGVGRYGLIPLSENDSAQHAALALKAARESMVLLKNDGDILPLTRRALKIAVIGPNAASLTALEGNYNAIPSHPVLPVDGIAGRRWSMRRVPFMRMGRCCRCRGRCFIPQRERRRMG
jgi:beta-glucosidase